MGSFYKISLLLGVNLTAKEIDFWHFVGYQHFNRKHARICLVYGFAHSGHTAHDI